MSAPAWADALEGFNTSLKAAGEIRQTTRWQYVQHIRWLATSSTTASPWEVTSGELVAWLDGQNWSAETRRKVVISLNQFYAWGVGSRFVEFSPTAGIPRRARRRPGPPAHELPELWRGPVDEWIAYLRAGARSEGTIEQYMTRIRGLSRLAADPWAVTGQQLSQWLSTPDWSPSTKRCSRVAVGSFYRWGVKARHLAESPVSDLDTVKVPRSLPRPTPPDALRDALAAADDRTRLAILLAAHAGLRRAEIAGLHTSQINDTHLVVVGKGGHHRIVPIDPRGDLAGALAAELARRRGGRHGTGFTGPFVTAHGYLFPSTVHAGAIGPGVIGRLVSEALPKGWTAHTLRHRFATDAYASERDLLTVQRLLGHARPETTSIYAQPPDGALLAAVIGAGPTRLRNPRP